MCKKTTFENFDKDYRMYSMSEVSDHARMVAVRWIENFKPDGGFELEQKTKLASDIMNIAEQTSIAFGQYCSKKNVFPNSYSFKQFLLNIN